MQMISSLLHIISHIVMKFGIRSCLTTSEENYAPWEPNFFFPCELKLPYELYEVA